jgi:hypothetical protein
MEEIQIRLFKLMSLGAREVQLWGLFASEWLFKEPVRDVVQLAVPVLPSHLSSDTVVKHASSLSRQIS